MKTAKLSAADAYNANIRVRRVELCYELAELVGADFHPVHVWVTAENIGLVALREKIDILRKADAIRASFRA